MTRLRIALNLLLIVTGSAAFAGWLSVMESLDAQSRQVALPALLLTAHVFSTGLVLWMLTSRRGADYIDHLQAQEHTK